MRVIELHRAVALALALGSLFLGARASADEPPAPAQAQPTPEGTPTVEATAAPAVAPSAPTAEAAPAPAAAPTRAAGFFSLAPRGAAVDIAGFPPRPAAVREERERGVELHGFVAAWATPVTGDAPSAQTDAFRLRFAVLRVDARPIRNVTVTTRLAPTVPGSPLLDAMVTYSPHDAFGVTAGQFRLPIGASATTLAPQIVMLDRPSYVYAMTKVAFRDVGMMVHSGPRGIADGLLHYRAVMASGGGRMGTGTSRAPGTPGDALYAVRVLFDAGRLLFDQPASRLALGASYVRSRDPAIDTGTAATDRSLATNVLGRTLVPYGLERVTQLVGADLTFAHRGIHAQAEMLYLHSKSTDATARAEALGASLEVAYTLPFRPRDTVDLQLAARGERFDPRFGQDHDQQHLLQLGLNAIAGPVRGSVFGTVTFFDDPTTGAARTAGELTFRAAAAF